MNSTPVAPLPEPVPSRGVRKRFLLRAIVLLGLIGPGAHLPASEPQPVSHESRPGHAPRAAALPGGAFVVVWASPPSELEPGAIFGRLLDDRGIPRGPIFEVSESPITAFTAEGVAQVDVTSLVDGSFFVAWRFEAEPGDGEIYGRQFSQTGSQRAASFSSAATSSRSTPTHETTSALRVRQASRTAASWSCGRRPRRLRSASTDACSMPG